MNFEAELGRSAFEDMDRLFRGVRTTAEPSEKRAGSTGWKLRDFKATS